MTPASTREWPARWWKTTGTGIPDGGAQDRPRSVYGFPEMPGLLDAMRRPFRATGLGLPWYTVHGNHDNMMQGTVPATGWLREFPAGRVKFVSPPDGLDAAQALAGFTAADPEALLELSRGRRLSITADPGRTPVTRQIHVREHFRTTGAPAGHGYSQRNADDGTAYYAFDAGIVRCISIDTVNPHGGWQGSLDETQFGWLDTRAHRVRGQAGGAVQPSSDRDPGQRSAAAGGGPADPRR